METSGFCNCNKKKGVPNVDNRKIYFTAHIEHPASVNNSRTNL